MAYNYVDYANGKRTGMIPYSSPNDSFYTNNAGNPAADVAGTAANLAGGAGGIKGLWSKLKGVPGKAQLGWNKNTGVSAFGKNIGKAAPFIQGGLGALQAAGGLSDLSKAATNTDDLKSSITRSAMGNPLLSSYLTSDQLAMLNTLKHGNEDTGFDVGDIIGGIGKGLPNTLLQAGIGLGTGGIPGAVVGGVSGLVNSGIEGAVAGQQQGTADLEGLYQALMDAEAQYKSMKRPNFTGLGIQQQYQNMYA